MADVAVESAPAAPTTPKKTKAAAGAKKPAKKPTHPKTSEMVNNAIADLKERGGSSLQAIKKFIAANYKVDAEKLAPFIRRYLKAAVESGALVRTKGKGAAGSFKLDVKTKTTATGPKKAAKKTITKAAKPAGPKAGGIKKRKVTPKKATAAKPKKVKAETPKKAAKPKATPTKAKKSAKPPTKPKTPKAKKAVSAKSKPATKKTAKK